MAKQKSLRLALVIGWVVLGLFAFSGYAEQPPKEVWNKVFDSGYVDYSLDVAVDKAGNVYVTGWSYNGTDFDYRTIKYAPDGSIQWNKVYNSSGNDYALGVAVDESGNVYVTGHFIYPRIRTWDWGGIRYDPNGNITGITTFDSGYDDYSYGVAVDKAGNVYVTGWFYNGMNTDFRTIKYAPDGSIQWNKVYDGGASDWASDVAVGQVGFAGYVYVTGGSTISTSTGYRGGYRTIKYDLAGNIQWNKTFSGGFEDRAQGVAVDKNGNVYVTGWSWNITNVDTNVNYRTIKYDPDGNIQWNKVYDGGSDDKAWSVAVDDAGNVYVTGYSWNGMDSDYRTIKYALDGSILWNKGYDSGDNDWAYGVAVDKNGYVYVTGWSIGNYRTIKYRQSLSVKEHASIPDGFKLSLDPAFGTSARIRYQLPNPCWVNLAVYDASGRRVATLINEKIQSGNYEYLWTPENTGVYFARLSAGEHRLTSKFICLR